MSGQTRDGRYYRARYYHPTLQRFISEDPIGFEGGDVNLYAYVGNAPVNFDDPSGMYVAPGTIPQHCRDPLTIPLTPELSGRKGLLAQVVAAELTFLGIVWDALACTSILPTPAAGIVGGARGGAQSAANATRLARQLTGEAQVAELLAGGGRVIAGPGSKVPLRDAARLAREYGARLRTGSRSRAHGRPYSRPTRTGTSLLGG